MKEIRKLFHYRKLWKHQKNKNKHLRRQNNKLRKGIAEELKLDVTNEEIHKLKIEVERLKKQVIKANLEAQKYFDMLMDKLGGVIDE